MIRYFMSILSLGAILTAPLFGEEENRSQEKMESIYTKLYNLSKEELSSLSATIAKKMVRRIGFIENSLDGLNLEMKSASGLAYYKYSFALLAVESISPYFPSFALIKEEEKDLMEEKLAEKVAARIEEKLLEEGFLMPFELSFPIVEKGKVSYLFDCVAENEISCERFKSPIPDSTLTLYLDQEKSVREEKFVLTISEKINLSNYEKVVAEDMTFPLL